VWCVYLVVILAFGLEPSIVFSYFGKIWSIVIISMVLMISDMIEVRSLI
jgi:hypothetical protein